MTGRTGNKVIINIINPIVDQTGLSNKFMSSKLPMDIDTYAKNRKNKNANIPYKPKFQPQ